MANQEIREMLKIDLGITVTNYDPRLDAIILSAEREITAAGATLDLTDPRHVQVVIIYAAWMWRRRDTGAAMPPMVRRALNNLVFGQKMAAGEDHAGESE